MLDEAIEYGGFPEVVSNADADGKLGNLRLYRNSYFTRDLAQLAHLENVEAPLLQIDLERRD